MAVSYHSETISEIAKALSAFQAAVPTIPKNKTVNYFSKKLNCNITYAYSPYDTIIENIKNPLKENGLSFTQLVVADELVTMLLHSSGEWFRTSMKLTCTPADQQGYGSDITYKRRYSLSAILGIATDEDDDGQKAQESDNSHHETPSNEEPPKKKVALTSKSKGWKRAIEVYKEDGNLDKVKEHAEVSPEVEQQIKDICNAESNNSAEDEEVPF